MSIRAGLYGLLCMAAMVNAEAPEKLFYSASADFVEMRLSLKTAEDTHPGYVGMDVVLSPQARARTAAVTARAMNKCLTLYVNGRPLSTATVRSVLDSGKLRFFIPREMLLELMPSLMP